MGKSAGLEGEIAATSHSRVGNVSKPNLVIELRPTRCVRQHSPHEGIYFRHDVFSIVHGDNCRPLRTSSGRTVLTLIQRMMTRRRCPLPPWCARGCSRHAACAQVAFGSRPPYSSRSGYARTSSASRRVGERLTNSTRRLRKVPEGCSAVPQPSANKSRSRPFALCRTSFSCGYNRRVKSNAIGVTPTTALCHTKVAGAGAAAIW